jgi:hypothetical protein
MSIDFYKQNLPPGELEQGDLLSPDSELRALLEQYHPYYAQHKENKLYAVLTQSCDLVRREDGYKAHYISIAPVRPLRVIIRYEFERKFVYPDDGAPFGAMTLKGEIERFLERLLNNNEASHFYYRAAPQSALVEPMCAMLALPISLKVEHYDAILRTRILGVESVFQAKLGWLLGQMYSRVGTPELEPSQLRTEIGDITNSLAVWFENEDFKQFVQLLDDYKAENPGKRIDGDVSKQLIPSIKSRKKRVVDRVLDLASARNYFPTPSKERRDFRRVLEQDPDFARLF